MRKQMLRNSKYFAGIVVFLAMLSISGYYSFQIGKGNINKTNFFVKNWTIFVNMPGRIEQAFDQLIAPSPLFIKTEDSEQPINDLDSSTVVLTSFWNLQQSLWEFQLIDLYTEDIIHNWYLGNQKIPSLKGKNLMDMRPMHPILISDDEIIVKLSGIPYLARLNAQSEILWTKKFAGHHSMNLDEENNIWICGYREPTKLLNVSFPDGQERAILDNWIYKLDSKNGDIIYQKSISEIFKQNNLQGLLVSGTDKKVDVLHLNDIQPATKDTQFWKKGDVFLSLRNLSLVILYRPSTNEVIWRGNGPLLYQHDVDIISNSKIAVFNNQCLHTKTSINDKRGQDIYQFKRSTIIQYDFENDEFSELHGDVLTSNSWYSATEGLFELMDNGNMFIEYSNSGRFVILNKNGVILNRVLPVKGMEGYHHIGHWARIIN